MCASKIIVLMLYLSVGMGFQLPGCQDQSVVFIAEPKDVETGCGIDDLAIFNCHYNGSSVRPQWIINSTVYSSLNSALPPDHSYSNYQLSVRSGIKYNNTLYQCQLLPPRSSSDGSLCAYKSSGGKLIAKCTEGHCTRNDLELIATADCVCPGRNFTYECSVVGGSFTVWRGTAISPGCEVTLFHSMFSGVPGTTRGVCNNGDIVGYNIGVENDCYTSKLDILVSPGLNGTTVKCILDDSRTDMLISESTLSITTTPFPPPTNVRLVRATPGELTFSWSPPPQMCPSLTYNVISNDCGACRNNSAFSNTTCRGFTLPSTCTLTVQSIICGNLTSTDSSPITARLNVLEAPTVMEVYPYYSESDRRLLRLVVNFNTSQPFQIADGINGSASSYTVTYSDATSGSVCSSTVIPASSCTDEICTHASSSFCPSAANVNIAVFATNVLGNGPTSEPTFQDGINSLVDVNFNSEVKSIICVFLNQPRGTTKECSANITYGTNCGQWLGLYTNEDTGDSVSIPELPLIEEVSEYCFMVTGRSSNLTVNVVGTLNLIAFNMGTIDIATPTAVVAVSGVMALSLIIGLFWLSCRSKRSHRKQRKVMRDLAKAGALNVDVEYDIKPSTRILQFYVKDKPGALANALKAFQELEINILGVNSFDADPGIELRPEISIEYKCVQMEISSESNLKVPELISELQSSGHIIDVNIECNTSKSSEPQAQGQVNYNVKFLARHQVGTLVKTLSVFADHNIYIICLHLESGSRDVRYVQNHIRFEATNQQEVTLISELYATGLVMEVETLASDEHHIAKIKESHTHHGTMKGEKLENAFERERDYTQLMKESHTHHGTMKGEMFENVFKRKWDDTQLMKESHTATTRGVPLLKLDREPLKADAVWYTQV